MLNDCRRISKLSFLALNLKVDDRLLADSVVRPPIDADNVAADSR